MNRMLGREAALKSNEDIAPVHPRAKPAHTRIAPIFPIALIVLLSPIRFSIVRFRFSSDASQLPPGSTIVWTDRPHFQIQTRRVPPNATVTATVAAGSPGATAHREGLTRIVERAMADLSASQQADVRRRARGSFTPAAFSSLEVWEQNQRLAAAIRALHPNLRQGDPNLSSVGPRNTGEQALLDGLVLVANIVFNRIATGAMDADIDAVFGASNRATVKARYANAKSQMNTLHRWRFD